MTFKDRWSRAFRKSGSSTFTMASNDSNDSNESTISSSGSGAGSFLSRTFGLRSSKTSTVGTAYSDRGLGSSSSASTNKGVRTLPGAPSSSSGSNKGVGSTIDCPMAGQSKKCNKMPTLEDQTDDNDNDLSDDSGLRCSNMTEAQRHQAHLSAYRIKFGATIPYRGSFEEISPCNSRRVSFDMRP
ncbi:hypothetical protein Sste5346_002626 [Sporothrix stenoceras]|uniref:Uncharacterized protein n=1 Tax=Sporothrix stenoceras TaxID=5173 RepID=A0ABR3ZI80_9PEZI